jgi:hypothetical protein
MFFVQGELKGRVWLTNSDMSDEDHTPDEGERPGTEPDDSNKQTSKEDERPDKGPCRNTI